MTREREPETGRAPAGRYAVTRALPRAHGGACVRALMRATPEDFVVEEVLGFGADGHGDHAFLKIEKRGVNTEWLARQLARVAGVAPVAVGYAGLKDRHAVATQHFTVALAGAGAPPWHELESPQIRVLAVSRHRRKLRRGTHAGNRFRVRLRSLEGDLAGIDARIEALRRDGAPNYFGAQRFGREGANLERAWRHFSGGPGRRDRHRRGLYLSAARALLFNRVLGARVAAGTWARLLPGEVVVLDGSRSFFASTEADAALEARLERMDIHPSGPLWGRGASVASGEALATERAALAGCEGWCRGLEAAGLVQERRALRVPVRDLVHRMQAAARVVEVGFTLPRGAFATTVLAELADTDTTSEAGVAPGRES